MTLWPHVGWIPCLQAVLVASLAAPAAASSYVSPRIQQSFNFGWRWGPINRPRPLPPAPSKGCGGSFAFGNNDGKQCAGLSHKSQGDASEAACEAVCCNDNGCGDYQWKNASISGGGCWVGVCSQMNESPSWSGGHRSPPVPPPPVPPPPGPHPPQSLPSFDDSKWEIISTPHDALISQAPSQELCSNGCSGHSYLPRYNNFYRKHFQVPADWSSKAVWLTFDGVFSQAQVWLNGKNLTTHLSGYTSFSVRLDGQDLKYASDNVLAVYADSDSGRSGWWYEGGGIYRHVHLVVTSPVHVAPNGIGTFSNISSVTRQSTSGEREEQDSSSNILIASAGSASLHVRVNIENTGSEDAKAGQVQLTLLDPSGKEVGQQHVPFAAGIKAGGGSMEFSSTISAIQPVKLWTIRHPALYTLRVEVMLGGSATAVDSIDTSVGFRTLHFDSTSGMSMNGEHLKVRGFCDHNNFASLGMAVPDRVKLFRAQASRSVGGNGRRTSHNAPDPVMLDIYDHLGVTVMGENRKLGNSSEYETNMRNMVRRDRNHPSIHVWSFCNEAGCEGDAENGGPRFYEATYEEDGSRPTLANMFTFNDLLSKTIDVQGFSHRGRSTFEQAHKAMPDKPLYASECCSCNTMRGEDVSAGQDGLQRSFNGDCQASQTNATDGIDYAIGTMVWTLFDYYGEPSNGGWPYVSSTFGAFDLAGFPKGGAHWFRSQWLYGPKDDDAGKTFSTGDDTMVYIVESWKTAGPAKRDIHVYSNAPMVNLLVNGKPQTPQAIGLGRLGRHQSFATFSNINFAPGNVTAIAIDADNKTVATHARITAGAAAAIVLTVDVPSATTGTGTVLLLDGSDAGLLRATIVDGAGHRVEDATHNVSFRVVSGPGRVIGAHSGDPASHEHNQQPHHTAYHGLVRAVVGVTKDLASPRDVRQRMKMMERDNHVVVFAGRANEDEEKAALAADDIVVEASAPGLSTQRVTIKTSTDAKKDSVLAVAAQSSGKPVTGFQE